MRIITGQYKGRHFEVPRTFKARPTTDFAKENGISALDLFAGTGSISLEMLSRGCADVTSVELDREHSAFIRQCLQKLGDDRCTLIKGDVFRFLKSCRRKYDLIFADPPYALAELPKIPDLVLGTETGNCLLSEDGIFVFEHGKQNDFSQHPCFVEHRSYGSVNFTLFRPTPLPLP